MKCGLKTFPLAVDLDDSVKFVEAEFGIKGFAIVIKLYQAIYSRGYYIKWDIDAELLFIQDYCLSKVGRNLVSEIISSCVKRGVFDLELYKNFNILTSNRIQETFLMATRRNKEVILKKEYALPIVYTFLKNASKNGKNANILFENEFKNDEYVNICKNLREKERKGKERKEKKSMQKKIKESKSKVSKREYNLSNTCACTCMCDKNLKAFLEKNSQIILDDNNLNISNVDFSLLDTRIKESEFLKKISSFSWLYNKYDKILGGYYKNFTVKKSSSFENERQYSQEELNSFNSLDDIKI